MNTNVDIEKLSNAVVKYYEGKAFVRDVDTEEHIGMPTILVFKNSNNKRKLVYLSQHMSLEVDLGKKICDLSAALHSVSGGLSIIDVYSTSVIQPNKNKELQEKYELEHDILINILDRSVWEDRDDFKTIYQKDDTSSEIDIVDKVLYDVLSSGSKTTTIKKSILQSLIVFHIYERGEAGISVADLAKSISIDLHITIVEAKAAIEQALKGMMKRGRVQPLGKTKGMYVLSMDEMAKIKKAIYDSEAVEEQFIWTFKTTLQKHGISDADYDDLLEIFKEGYKDAFHKNLGLNSDERFEDKAENAFVKFVNKITDSYPNISTTDLLRDIEELCGDNQYLTKISASESFLSLYKNEGLSEYVNNKSHLIYLDTPVLLYYICSSIGYNSGTNSKSKWDNQYYGATCDLFSLADNKRTNIEFNVAEDYLREAVGEIRKAICIDFLLKHELFKGLSSTDNIIYNYYLVLRNSTFFEGKPLSLLDFCKEHLKINYLHVNNSSEFICRNISRLKEIVEKLGIHIYYVDRDEHLTDAKKEYEIELSYGNSHKTVLAVNQDVKQALYIGREQKMGNANNYACFYTSWDYSLRKLLKWMIKQYPNEYERFYVVNPSALASQLSLLNFDIDSQSITNAVFAYADNNYDVSSKVKQLYDEQINVINGYRNYAKLTLIDMLSDFMSKFVDYGEGDQDDINASDKDLTETLISEIQEIPTKVGCSMREFTDFLEAPSNRSWSANVIKELFEAGNERERCQELLAAMVERLNTYFLEKNKAEESFL